MSLRWKIAQAAEIRWWKHYLKPKKKEAYLQWKRAYWTDFIAATGLELSPNVTCLDAGCGPAGIFTILEEQRVVALDPLLTQYEKELDHFNPRDYPSVSFIAQSLENFDYQESFDYIFCLNAINHVEDIDKALDKLFALAKKGTHLLISIDAHNSKLLKRIFKALPGDILHPHQYDLQEYQQMFRSRGAELLNTILVKKERIFNYYLCVLKCN